MDLYETLGVDKSAKPDDIKKKYRKKAQETHPDRPSGDLEMFQQIQLAYDTLSDPGLRENYDKTGSTGRTPTLDEEAQGFLVSVFDHVLSLGGENEDYVRLAKEGLSAGIYDENLQVNTYKNKLAKLERVSGRVKVKDGDNLYQGLVDSKMAELREGIAKKEKRILVLEKAKEMLNNYEDAGVMTYV